MLSLCLFGRGPGGEAPVARCAWFSSGQAAAAPARPAIDKLLVANRGEIACRVLTTGKQCRRCVFSAGPLCQQTAFFMHGGCPTVRCLVRAAKRLGIPTVAVYSEADRHSRVGLSWLFCCLQSSTFAVYPLLGLGAALFVLLALLILLAAECNRPCATARRHGG